MTRKEGGKDMCFILFDHILVKLVEPSSPGRVSRTREIYSLSAEVMDFIEERHIHHILYQYTVYSLVNRRI